MKKVTWFFGVLLLSGNVQAVDGVFAEYGDNSGSVNMVRAGAIWDWNEQWLAEKGCPVTGFWEASLGRWQGQTAGVANNSITDIGLTPVFRWQRKNLNGLAPYAEAAIGVHLLSSTSINTRRLGSAFQFGSHVGAGARFGDRQQFELGYRFQHISNGGIKMPNQGINFHQAHFAYHY